MFKIEIGSMFAVCLSINETMMLEFPTIIESIICSNKNCEKYPSVIERPKATLHMKLPTVKSKNCSNLLINVFPWRNLHVCTIKTLHQTALDFRILNRTFFQCLFSLKFCFGKVKTLNTAMMQDIH
uniref:Uncharacterized protein n=1 Tax=Sipha flava TaxID=143950 RepID=A0A2S2QFY4_9HEMI